MLGEMYFTGRRVARLEHSVPFPKEVAMDLNAPPLFPAFVAVATALFVLVRNNPRTSMGRLGAYGLLAVPVVLALWLLPLPPLGRSFFFSLYSAICLLLILFGKLKEKRASS
jgi:hypothetical protein